jgi:hypothetical protein
MGCVDLASVASSYEHQNESLGVKDREFLID